LEKMPVALPEPLSFVPPCGKQSRSIACVLMASCEAVTSPCRSRGAADFERRSGCIPRSPGPKVRRWPYIRAYGPSCACGTSRVRCPCRRRFECHARAAVSRAHRRAHTRSTALMIPPPSPVCIAFASPFSPRCSAERPL
jgi:hypothetical protein